MKKIIKSLALVVILTAFVTSCENREVNMDSDEQGETFKDMPVDGIETHFNRIVVDGAEYLILERDRNNPHEGFGFMAYRPNKLLRRQDTIMSYLETVIDSQAEILAALRNTTKAQEKGRLYSIFQKNLNRKKPIVD